MSKRIGNVIVIEPEAAQLCDVCGKLEETRPYGPNGENICYGCGMKNSRETQIQMYMKLFGDSREKAESIVQRIENGK